MISIAVLISMFAYTIPITYPQETALPTDYGDLSQYTWLSYLANGGERTGFNDGPAPDRPEVLWDSRDIDEIGSVSSGMVAIDGMVITCSGGGGFFGGGGSGTIYALEPDTGDVIWQVSGSVGSSFSGTTIFAYPSGYFFTLSGGVHMYDTDGNLLWEDTTINPNAVYHPAVWVPEDGLNMIFGPVTSGDSKTRELFPDNTNLYMECGWNLSEPEQNWGTGNRFVWGHLMDNGGNPQLCYGDGKVYMGEYSRWGVYALDAKTGEWQWRVNLRDANGYAATYGDGKLFTHCQSAYVTAINTTDGSVIWQNPDGLDNRGYAVWHGIYAYDRVYWHDLGAGTTGETNCFNAETGEKEWGSWTFSMIGYYQFCCADGKIYGQQSDGSTTTGRPATPISFACWDAFTGAELWSLPISCNTPSIAYGNLYLFYSSRIVCYHSDNSVGSPPPEDWPMWRGNVEDPGVAMGQTGPVNLDDGPVWTFEAEAGFSASPAVVAGKVYIGSTDYNLYCLNVEDGSEVWRFSTQNDAPWYSSPAVANGRVYTGADDGTFYCLDANDGSLLHSKPDGDGSYRPFNVGLGQMQVRSSPIVYQNRIYVGGPTGVFYCFDMDLNEVWSYDTGTRIAGSASIEDNYVYIMSLNNRMYKFTLDGTLIFDHAVATSVGGGFFFNFGLDWATSPVVRGDYIWIGVTSDYLLCINSTNGEEIYHTLQPNIAAETSATSALYYAGSVYIPAGPTVVRCDADTGDNIWSAWGSWEIFSSCTLATDGPNGDAIVYSGTEAGALTVFDTTDGTPISWYTTGGKIQSTPALYDGKLIFGSANHEVYCFEDASNMTMEMGVEIESDVVKVDEGESAVVLAQLSPGIPDVELLVTFTDPDGAETHLTEMSDLMGAATFEFTPTSAGTWTVMSWWNGVDDLRGIDYPYAFSEQIPFEVVESPPALVAAVSPGTQEVDVGATVTLTASATGGKGPFTYQWYQTIEGVGVMMPGRTSDTLTVTLSDPNVYGYYCEITDSAVQVDSSDTAEVKVLAAGGVGMEVYIIVAVVAVAIIAIVAYMFLRKRK